MPENQFTRYSANVLLEAAAIQEKKGQDYQNALSRVRQVDHYPRGVNTILDTVNGKMLRMYSVLETMEAGGKVNRVDRQPDAWQCRQPRYTQPLAVALRTMALQSGE